LSRQQYNLVCGMLARREDTTLCTMSWRQLHRQYELGNLVDNRQLRWSRNDIRIWQELVESSRAAYEAAEAGADRTSIAEHSVDEKIAKSSVQDGRLFCHAINAPLFLTGSKLNGTYFEQDLHPDVEYRVHNNMIDIDRYDACIIIENLESFIYCQKFSWPSLPSTLVLYRGHDKASKAVKALLKRRRKSMDVYMFPDTDPAGISIAISTQEATHIMAPNIRGLDPKGILRDRFTLQLSRYPELQTRADGFSEDFQQLVSDLLQTGTAVSQEWLCAHKVPLELIPLH
jgi:hypothetical protein